LERRVKPEVVSSILDSVYAAETSPELWPAALEQLGQVFHCSCVSLVNKDRKT